MIRSKGGLTSTFDISKDFNARAAIGSKEGTRRSAISIASPTVVEALGNPEEIEQVAIASVPLGQIENTVDHDRSTSVLKQTKNGNSMGVRMAFAPQDSRKNISVSISERLGREMQSMALALIPTRSKKKKRSRLKKYKYR